MADLSASLGTPLDEWQEDVLAAGLGERSNGTWAARTVGVSAPRQQGKSELIVVRALAGVLLFDEQTIICSAHQADTAREVFGRLLDTIEANPTLERRVDSVMRAINREHVRFKSGQIIKIKARSIAGGRGFSCDCLLLDEAQILGAPAWATIYPTMSARANPQAWLFGTPPSEHDDGEVFARIRQSGIAGKDHRMAWLEWSADPEDDLDDPATWAKANPAYGTRISHEAIESERGVMTDDQFARERLGIWASAGGDRSVIPGPSWTTATDEQSIPVDRITLGVECGPDLAWASVALAGQRADGGWHLELDDDQHTRGRGTAWLAPQLQHLVESNPHLRAVVADVAGPISALLEKRTTGRATRWYLKGTRVEITPVRVSELGAGCARLLDGITTGWLRHLGQPQLNAAALSAGKRPLADSGLWVWSRRTAQSDVTPIQAATLALIGAQADKVKKPERAGRAGGRREAVVA